MPEMMGDEFKKWFYGQLKPRDMTQPNVELLGGCWDAAIATQAKDISALRECLMGLISDSKGRVVGNYFLHCALVLHQLIDEHGKPTPLLAGDRKKSQCTGANQ